MFTIKPSLASSSGSLVTFTELTAKYGFHATSVLFQNLQKKKKKKKKIHTAHFSLTCHNKPFWDPKICSTSILPSHKFVCPSYYWWLWNHEKQVCGAPCGTIFILNFINSFCSSQGKTCSQSGRQAWPAHVTHIMQQMQTKQQWIYVTGIITSTNLKMNIIITWKTVTIRS
jgi:hypothetical protein